MATLYQSASQSRKIILGILVFFIIVLIFSAYSNILTKNSLIQNTPSNRFYMNADQAFGLIDNQIVPGIEYNSDAQFSLESVHGSYPDVAYVYKIEEPREKLFSLESAIETVNELEFSGDAYKPVDENNFSWYKDNNTKRIDYNKKEQIWKMVTLYYENPDAIARKTLLPTLGQYESNAKNLINRLNFKTFGFDSGDIESSYVKLGLDGIFLKKDLVTEADYVFLDYYRRIPQADLKPDDDLPVVEDKASIPLPTSGKVYSDDPRYGQIHTVVSNQLRDLGTDIFEINFSDFEYNLNAASYLLISADEAWSKIQTGGGSLVMIQPQGVDYYSEEISSADVRKFIADARQTELAYWEPKDWKQYVYPIFVFRGRAEMKDGRQANFVFYVDAIKRVS